VKRFLCGVEGVRETGSEEAGPLLGGVRDLVGSWLVVELLGSNVVSGERFGGVGWGIVVSNNSDRSKVEKVRFAVSADINVSLKMVPLPNEITHIVGNAIPHVVCVFSVLMVLLVNCRREAD
jgi:hypothetical protein